MIRHLKSQHAELYDELEAKNLSRQQRVREDKENNRSESVEGTKTAYVWKFFEKVGPSSAVCTLCKKCMSNVGGNTSGLSRHIEGKHSDLFRSVCYNCKSPVSENEGVNQQCQVCDSR